MAIARIQAPWNIDRCDGTAEPMPSALPWCFASQGSGHHRRLQFIGTARHRNSTSANLQTVTGAQEMQMQVLVGS